MQGILTSDITYDAFGAPATMTTTSAAGTVYAPTFTYDTLGRVATKKEGSTTFGYSYDANGRLIGTTKNGVVDTTYTYDANGNRTDGGVVVDGQDRMTAGFGATYTYTPNGELATVTSGANVTTYGYDGRGQLVSAALPGGKTVTYAVDALGRRITKTLNGTVTNRFVYGAGLSPLAEVDATGSVTTRYVYGPLSQTPAYLTRGGFLYAIVTDQLGSVRSVVKVSDGTVAQAITYDPWGKVLTDTTPAGQQPFQPFGFAGGLYDKDTGLVHFGAREYDPASGRWTRKDPSRFGGGANLYGYAYGDPVNLIDPTGDKAEETHYAADAIAGIQNLGLGFSRDEIFEALSSNGLCASEGRANSPLGRVVTGLGAVAMVLPAGARIAGNIANGPRLAQQLAAESASSMFTATGELTPEAIQGAEEILNGSELGNQAVVDALTKDGSDIANWGKYTTDSFRTPSGLAQVHFYYNESTGTAEYGFDYKTVFNHQGRR